MNQLSQSEFERYIRSLNYSSKVIKTSESELTGDVELVNRNYSMEELMFDISKYQVILHIGRNTDEEVKYIDRKVFSVTSVDCDIDMINNVSRYLEICREIFYLFKTVEDAMMIRLHIGF